MQGASGEKIIVHIWSIVDTVQTGCKREKIGKFKDTRLESRQHTGATHRLVVRAPCDRRPILKKKHKETKPGVEKYPCI